MSIIGQSNQFWIQPLGWELPLVYGGFILIALMALRPEPFIIREKSEFTFAGFTYSLIAMTIIQKLLHLCKQYDTLKTGNLDCIVKLNNAIIPKVRISTPNSYSRI